MGDKTKIAWTDATWNTVVGCSKVSPGCRECYAEKLLATRLKHIPVYGSTIGLNGKWIGNCNLIEKHMGKPFRWRKPRKIFVNDLGDTFHETVPFEFIAVIWGVMAACPQHTFQVLTKRPDRMLEFFDWIKAAHAGIKPGSDGKYSWSLPNVWLGVSCEDQTRADERIPTLLQCPAPVRFVSAEPLLGPIVMKKFVDWVIVGGESGPQARPCDIDWIRSILDQCKAAGKPCFIKQLGANVAKTAFAIRGKPMNDPDKWPEYLRVRDWPNYSPAQSTGKSSE